MKVYPIILVDGHNLFIRGYSASSLLNKNGEHIGGLVSVVKTLTFLMKTFSPSHCFIAWDTGGGSSKRRSIYKDYKHGNKPKRLNREYEHSSSASDSSEYELAKTVKMLECLPVKQFFIEDCEADDVIYNLCNKLQKYPKIIVSTDKDYFQLINENTFVYNPITKKIISMKNCSEYFGASNKNIIGARIFLGDKSDNIDGINGVGDAWIKKNLNILQEDKSYQLNEIINYIKENLTSKKSKIVDKILENINILERNWKLMDLSSITLAGHQLSKLESLLENEDDEMYTFKQITFKKKLCEDGIQQFFDEEVVCQIFMQMLCRSRRTKLFDNHDDSDPTPTI